jgi:ubiquinone/menaquinone biosynthesis C-methylase UbiE
VHELQILQLKKYITYSLGQNNGYVSYGLLAQASLSIVENQTNSEFKKFVRELCISNAPILDIGCGLQEMPVYLSELPNELIGLDPFDSQFNGTFIKGSAEYIPLRPSSIGTVICATSIDHLFDIELAFQEFRRILIPGGRVIIWDHAGNKPSFNIIRSIRLGFYAIRGKYKINFPKKRYQIYDNGVVLPIPKGFADPFHTPMSRKRNWSEELRKMLSSAGYQEIRKMDRNGFSCWETK